MNTSTQPRYPNAVNLHSVAFRAALLALFVLAAAIRLVDLYAPGAIVVREYNSAIIARALYFENNVRIESWRQEAASITRDQLSTLEPPVTEYLVSGIYRLMGNEQIAYSRFLTTTLWIIGGVFLYLTTTKILSASSAFLGLVFYLFTPWGIIISRSFQPDSLMMMMFLISLYLVVIYFEKPNWKRLLLATIITGLALLFRPLVLFSLYSVFIALFFFRNNNARLLISPQLLFFILVSISLPAVYYGIGILNGSLQGQTELSFRPYLLLRPTYWKVFIQMGLSVIGTIATAGAILGFFLTDRSFVRFIIVGLLTGYVVFGLVFNYHIITHDYYHIQAFALVTIGLAACAQHLIQALQRSAPQFWLAPIAAIILLSVYTGTTEARETLYQQNFEDPRIATEIGELIHHSSRTVYVASHYGLPLIYYGEFSGADWRVRIEDPLYRPTGEKERSVEERLSHLGFEPEYFVITNFNLMERKHADLQAYLDKNCRILVEREQFLIYNSCT